MVDIIASEELAAREYSAEADIPCGLRFVQDHIGGYVAGDMVTYAGRTNIGKSHLALASLSACAKAGSPALYASLEDPERRVGRRVRNGYATRGLYCVFPPPGSSALLTTFRTARAKYGVQHFCVDYFQKVRYDGDIQCWSKPDMMDVALTQLEQGVAALGGVLHVVSQVTRPPQGVDPTDFPKLYEMKESAAIENAADIVFILGNVKGRPMVEVAKAKDARAGLRFAMVRDQATGVLREPGSDDDGQQQRKQAAAADDGW